MFIVYLYVRATMVGHTKFGTIKEANEYAEQKTLLGYKVLVVDKT